MDILNTKIKSILTEKNTKILPENIKKDVNILGVTGSVVELNGETKTVTPTTSSQTIVPTGTGKNALTQVTVNGVTSAIDANITAGNIKKDVTILNVTGTFEGGTSNYNAKLKALTSTDRQIQKLITELAPLDLSNTTDMSYVFYFCASLLSLPEMDTSGIINAQSLCYGCESLTTVPVYNFSSLTGNNNYNMFQTCPSLSNESLNNILATCITMTNATNKNLKYMGITSTQATTCQSLSNWSNFVAAGWGTGY